ncbi:adenylate kinase [Candidatus Woesearchaeota archaeon]|nr:adenylate kinase [Candidatus Woesearchaeota archaeon]
MKNIILIGAPNAGKGTYSASLIKKYNIPHISTGDMFREAMKNKTPVGLEAKKYIDEGNLVPDEVTIKLVKERLSQPDCKDGFILDGFPRTLAQAEALDKITEITNVIMLDVREEVIIQRVSGRIQCRKCGAIFHKTNLPPKKEGVCDKCGGELYTRDDDKPEAVRERLVIFAKQTEPLVDYYEKKGIVGHVDANNPRPPEVVEEIIKIIGD